MNEQAARKRIKALKGFYSHLMVYAVFIGSLAIINFMTYRDDQVIWVVYPLVSWGAVVFLHGWGAHGFGWGRKWEEEKLRQLTGWDATRDELARLSDRVDALLTILSGEKDGAIGSELEEIRTTLLDAKRTIDHYQSPLDESAGTKPMDKRTVIRAIEKLEALLTRHALQRFEDLPGRE